MKIEDCLEIIDRESAWEWIVKHFLPQGPKCPGCSAPIASPKALLRFFALQRTYCKECDRVFTPTAGSPIHETSWQPEEFVKLMILSLAGRTPVEIAQYLAKSASSVRDMLAKVELLQAGEPRLVQRFSHSSGIKRARAAEGAGMETTTTDFPGGVWNSQQQSTNC